MPADLPDKPKSDYDCIIIGGGAAGLSAGLVLARSRRQVLVIDAGLPSNGVSKATHGLFTRDGIVPSELYSLAQSQFTRYPAAAYLKGSVSEVKNEGKRFVVVPDAGPLRRTRTVLLAQGVRHELPAIEGLTALWGSKAWHCPYCDGFEASDKKLIAVGTAEWIDYMSIILPTWSRNLIWSPTDRAVAPNVKERIRKAGGSIIGKLVAVTGKGQGVSATLSAGRIQEAHALVVDTLLKLRDGIASNLMCKTGPKGHLVVDEYGRTSITGVYGAGDQASQLHQAATAAASGLTAGIGINLYLSQLDRTREQ